MCVSHSVEDFQDWGFTAHCQEDTLVQYIDALCRDKFIIEMQSVSTENWCILENIIR